MKKIYYFLLFFSSFSFAQTSVTMSAGFGEEVPTSACLACAGTDWNSPMNVTAADGAYASTTLNQNGFCFQSACYYSRYLYAHNFGFAIPAGATIDSIIVSIKRAAVTASSAQDTIVQLEKSGVVVGSNLASSVIWPTIAAYENYGSADPLWSTTWLPADINDPTSGVAMKVKNISSSQAQLGVDHIQMTVYYNTTTGFFSITSSPSNVEWISSPEINSVNVQLNSSTNCSSKLYDATGQLISSSDFGNMASGQFHFDLDKQNLAEGIYTWQILIGSEIYSRKIIILQ